MNKTFNTRARAFRFRRFCRAGWAAFRSMHREVNIGRVASYIADRQMGKAVATLSVAALMVPAAAQAQSDGEREVRTLASVEVSVVTDSLFGSPEPVAVFTAQDLQKTNIRSIGDIVEMLPGVDLRVRGVGDAQADISMRGGTMDQVVVLLNGVNLADAQTGHHTMDLPVDMGMVERVELLTPAQLLSRGIVAFCGGVNIVVSEEYADRLLFSLSGGSYGTVDASALASKVVGRWALTAAGSYHQSDGYMPNTDYRHGSLFVQATRHAAADDWHLQVGGQMKGFGSQAFYSTTYPDQYEATRTLTASVFNVHRWGRTRMETALYGRLHRDRFELFRDGYVDSVPAWYGGHNHHLGSIAGMRSRVVVPLWVGEAIAGVAVRHEGIVSNVLGELDDQLDGEPYTKSAARTTGSLFAGYHVAGRRWEAEAMLMGTANSRFGSNGAWAAGGTYTVGHGWWVRGNVGRGYRDPTFTDLYYQGVNQQANPGLKAESNINADVAMQYEREGWRLSWGGYYRAGRDIIDWVRSRDRELWLSMNHTKVDAYGIEAQAAWGNNLVHVRASYSYCLLAQDAGEWVSGSALDYLRHKAVAVLMLTPAKGLSLKWQGLYRYREGYWVSAGGEMVPYGDVWLMDAAVEYTVGATTVSVGGYNLLDSQYRDHGGVPQPGRSWRVGVRCDIR